MYQRNAIVSIEEGLHARPAARVVQFAKSFACDIEIEKAGKKANAKSTVKLMLLGVKQGEEIIIRADGEGAQDAVEGLAAIVTGTDDKPAGASHSAAAVPFAPPAAAGAAVEGAGSAVLRGLAGAEGVAVGRAFVYLPVPVEAPHRAIAASEVAGEIARFRAAVDSVSAMLSAGESGTSDILGALRDVAQDPELLLAVEGEIKTRRDAATAVLHVGQDLADRFSHIDDAYFRTRAEDMRGVARQIACVLLGIEDNALSGLSEPAILVAGAMSALDFARLPLKRVRGLVTTEGGPTSHVAIIARSLGFPAVVGAHADDATLRSAQTVALDGGAGIAILNPDEATTARFAEREAQAQEARAALRDYVSIAPRTRAGAAIEVAANLGSLAEVEGALEFGAMGVGLFRTEFLFMQGASLPTEDEQTRVYSRLAEAFAPHPVIIRTLDIGGDKPLPGMAPVPEENPFLGWRGIRMCLDQPEIFRPQLRAILRAATRGRIKVMFPMISDLTEVIAARAVLDDCRRELEAAGIATGPLEIGIMIETPAAALCAPELAKAVDFFSIGTNDLTQYTMAADRTNQRLGRLHRADHPAVLRMIELACQGARQAGIWVGVCGEAAGDPALIPTLISYGVTELSMSPSLIPRAKKRVTEV